VNSDASHKALQRLLGPEWDLLWNTLQEPVHEVIAVEVESTAQADDIISASALLEDRERVVVDFRPHEDDAGAFVEKLQEMTSKSDGGDVPGLLFCCGTGDDEGSQIDFWKQLNLLREPINALGTQTVFLLLPRAYEEMSRHADHLKRWMTKKIRLREDGKSQENMDEGDSKPSQEARMALMPPQRAREKFTVLENQLREAKAREVSEEQVAKSYYLPMFAAAVSLGDVHRSESLLSLIKGSLGKLPTSDSFQELLIEHALDARNLDDARQLAQARLIHAWESNDGQATASTYHQLGRIAQEQRDFAGAEKCYLKSLEINKKLANKLGAARSCHQLGMIFQEQRDFERARKWYLKSLGIKEEQGDEHGMAMSYHQLGIISQEQRDFGGAEKWYLRSLSIEEGLGNEHGMAITYHQLGRIAEVQRNYSAAETWYSKSLAISEKQGNKHGAAITYHQLGIIAQVRGDFEGAEKWYLKSLEIKEKQGSEHGAASTYHQLGMNAQERSDYTGAEKWYLKSLGVKKKQANERGAAITYHQLGMNAQEQSDYAGAEKWYLKSLGIKEKQGNEHGAAGTYHQLGRIAEERRDFVRAAKFLVNALQRFKSAKDDHSLGIARGTLDRLLKACPSEMVEEVRKIIQDGLGEEGLQSIEDLKG